MKKDMVKRVMAAFMTLAFVITLVYPKTAVAARTYYETLEVGKTRALIGSDKVSEAVNKGSWGVFGNSSTVRIVSQTYYSCLIEAVKPTNGSVAIVRYNYNYITYLRNFPYIGNGFIDFYVTVTGSEVSSITVSPQELNLDVGDGYQLTTKITPSNATASISYSSNNTSVAKVSDSGYVRAVGAGTTRIYASTGNGKSDYCLVNVSVPALSLSGVSPSGGSTNVSVKTSVKFTFNSKISAGENYGNITLKDNTANKNVDFTKEISGSSLTLTPSTELEAGHSFTATVPVDALVGSSGLRLKTKASTTFTTKVLEFISISPSSGSKNVKTDQTVVLTYAGEVKKGTHADEVSITSEAGVNIPCSISTSGNQFIITPGTNYEYSTLYTVNVPAGAVANASGVDEPAGHKTEFTTLAEVKKPVIKSVEAYLIDGASIVFVEAENVPENAVFIAAGYSADDELLGISRVDGDAALLDESIARVKVFVIDSYDSLNPLTEYEVTSLDW